RRRYPFWLHVDGTFGLVAAASPRYRQRLAGLEHADSITVDGHKWLNVPYDGGYSYTRHLTSRLQVFRNASPYLPPPVADPRNVLHLGPENSRRWRALPLWFTLLAYGREGVRDLVERCCDLAAELGQAIEGLEGYRLAAPVQLNITCIEAEGASDPAALRRLQQALTETGEVYATPSLFQGRPVLRMAFCNWRTGREDVKRIVAALEAVRGAAG
ncbi:MAG: aspartate aminotransferase family protein, partial [Acidobacteria bacterium]|nr:aspartate aminotransferase family protein [Acidobacteriota bacterium]